jgi:hypothetical protein
VILVVNIALIPVFGHHRRCRRGGKTEFHAWGDSNLYLRRNSDDPITLTANSSPPWLPPDASSNPTTDIISPAEPVPSSASRTPYSVPVRDAGRRVPRLLPRGRADQIATAGRFNPPPEMT